MIQRSLLFQLALLIGIASTAFAFQASGTHIQRAATTRTPESRLFVHQAPDKSASSSANDESESPAPQSNKWRRQFSDSLVETTKRDMEDDEIFQNNLKRYQDPRRVQREERAKRRRALDGLGVPSFGKFVPEMPVRKPTQILQLNIGLYCNQACTHCHVESSPARTEAMTIETASKCLSLLNEDIHTLDITGGAPELNPAFRYLVSMARDLYPDLTIIDRCNLTVLQEPGQEDLVDFLVKHKVRVIASLPCYSADNVDAQRGNGVFERSIASLIALNDAGYGKGDSDLVMDLVYNPSGGFLPPEQSALEVAYKKELAENFGITFDSLFTFANMPIKRFADQLLRDGKLTEYMELLVNSFNPATLQNLMCTDTLSVNYNGDIYDCDFNQQLEFGKLQNVFDISQLDDLAKSPIRVDNHCFGCTAGMGSS